MKEGTGKRWIADVGTKQWQNTKRYTPCVCSSLKRCSPQLVLHSAEWSTSQSSPEKQNQ